MKDLEAWTSKWNEIKTSTNMDEKYAWKLIPTKDNELSMNRVLIDGKTKTYYWCPNHHSSGPSINPVNVRGNQEGSILASKGSIVCLYLQYFR
jgi:hypothetical protein